MDIASILGIILGVLTLIVGMIAKGASPSALVNPAALIIIFVGTFSAILVAFPFRDLKKFPSLLKTIFTTQNTMTETELVDFFVDKANITKREGILGLQKGLEDIQEPFLKKGIELILEGKTSEDIENILYQEIDAREERHSGYSSIFTLAGSFAPTLGVLGAVIGLISALGNLNDMDKLGHSIAAAFVATLYGIFTGYVLMHPMANKLKRKSKQEILIANIAITGILALQEGSSAMTIKSKLMPYLPQSAQRESGESDGQTS
ncbi:flagellar motor stator protein MotA [Bacillus cereus]|uniref:Flagellar motor rotation protein MotA n=1 Tax=Bacillus cereus TaxID=1396 RepID=A0A164KF46_BACCE|nr:flagellar motor stator protein MotA [Bacillus cereus]KZD50171.1 Flagellar motor rotation protein MotA [Bacillus cereus]HDR8321910.1 flagellar motor stator protein MotA [Bacillus cereus]HDR8329061.1 flagellar motor stator protein MotA [Bacillus cereus]HDR8335815.1 flagellar motor stator protein MotA [Bacillus cereus]